MHVLPFLLATAVLLATAYAHAQLPYHTAGRRNVFVLRAVLVAAGVALGYTTAAAAAGEPARALLAFVTGFGAVHVPAALILLIKRQRGEGKS
jgi:hypothetical protein